MEIINLPPKPHDTKAETQNPKPKTQNPKPKTQNPKPDSNDPKLKNIALQTLNLKT
jgi:hypothetical protein